MAAATTLSSLTWSAVSRGTVCTVPEIRTIRVNGTTTTWLLALRMIATGLAGRADGYHHHHHLVAGCPGYLYAYVCVYDRPSYYLNLMMKLPDCVLAH
jgi:hypothetical protein